MAPSDDILLNVEIQAKRHTLRLKRCIDTLVLMCNGTLLCPGIFHRKGFGNSLSFPSRRLRASRKNRAFALSNANSLNVHAQKLPIARLDWLIANDHARRTSQPPPIQTSYDDLKTLHGKRTRRS